MTDMQRASYHDLAERYCIPFSGETLDLAAAFPRRKALVLEIGFGMGIATASIAESMPELDFLGAEVHRPGIGKLMSELEARGISNVRIVEGDAVEIMERGLAEASLSGINLFFPDPWPKKRHHKRRIMGPDFAALAASRLSPGGWLYMVTDWEEYAHDALTVLRAEKNLENSSDGFAERLPWRPVTKFERKALAAGREIRELYFTRTAACLRTSGKDRPAN